VRDTEILLQVVELGITYSRWGQRVRALEDVNLKIPPGQWLILIGPNGSGKSTLLNAIAGRLVPDSGQVFLDGAALDTMGPRELSGHVFQVHQDPLRGSAPLLTVFENLLIADDESMKSGVRKVKLMNKYEELLGPLGLRERLRQPVQTLSGGERQLLALLIARLRPARLILLDEPLAALDPAKVEMCLALLADLQKIGKTLIQVTHDPDEAARRGDRTVALLRGRVVYDKLGERSLDEVRGFWYSPAEFQGGISVHR